MLRPPDPSARRHPQRGAACLGTRDACDSTCYGREPFILFFLLIIYQNTTINTTTSGDLIHFGGFHYNSSDRTKDSSPGAGALLAPAPSLGFSSPSLGFSSPFLGFSSPSPRFYSPSPRFYSPSLESSASSPEFSALSSPSTLALSTSGLLRNTSLSTPTSKAKS